MEQRDLLNYAIENGMISFADVEKQFKMKEKEKYLKMHPFSIYKGKDGAWYTYLPDQTKQHKRRQVRRASRNDLENVVVGYWKEVEENPTIKEVFDEWNDRRLKLGKIKYATHSRNEQIFKRHFYAYSKRRIKNIQPEEITDFLEEQISICNLDHKAFSNLKTITRGFLKRAKKRKLISFNVEAMLQELDVSEKDFKIKVVQDEKEIFYDDEMDRILEYCYIHEEDVCSSGVALMFVTGMRVGEVVALKKSDISDNVISVHRTETRYGINGKAFFEVSDYPKTLAGIRKVIVPDNYSWLIDRIMRDKKEDEYLFVGKAQNRLHTHAIRKRLYMICEKLGISVRSPHKARKTYGTILLDNNVDNKIIEKQMGHTDISCTENFYHRDRRNLEQKRNVINSIPEFNTRQFE